MIIFVILNLPAVLAKSTYCSIHAACIADTPFDHFAPVVVRPVLTSKFKDFSIAERLAATKTQPSFND